MSITDVYNASDVNYRQEVDAWKDYYRSNAEHFELAARGCYPEWFEREKTLIAWLRRLSIITVLLSLVVLLLSYLLLIANAEVQAPKLQRGDQVQTNHAGEAEKVIKRSELQSHWLAKHKTNVWPKLWNVETAGTVTAGHSSSASLPSHVSARQSLNKWECQFHTQSASLSKLELTVSQKGVCGDSWLVIHEDAGFFHCKTSNGCSHPFTLKEGWL